MLSNWKTFLKYSKLQNFITIYQKLKKKFNYKGFQCKLESNLFFRKNLKEDNKSVKILVGYKMKDNEDDENSTSPYDV